MSSHASSRFSPRLSRGRLAAIATAAAALTLGTLPSASSTAPAPGRTSAASAAAAAPSLLVEVAPTRVDGARRGVVGTHLRVRLRDAVLPTVATGQRVALPIAGRAQQATIDRTERRGDVRSWAGALAGVPLSSFSLVRAGDTYRGSLVSPAGVYSLVAAGGGDYWWSEVEPRRLAEGAEEGPDVVTLPDGHDHAASDRQPGAREARAKRRAKINVLFGYTKAAKAEAGSKAQLKASAALVVSQTNEAFRNSGLKVTLRYKGLVKARGKESGTATKDVKRLYKPRDGRFDNLHKARRKNRADLVHLFTTGSQYDLCGAGNLPLSVRGTHKALAFSTSFYSCMPYLVATHEFGHNLGADHIGYGGVSHYSKIPYAYGYYDVGRNYLSVMGYYTPCEDQGVFTCVRIPWFSSPTNTYNGQPLGIGKPTNNTKVISKIAPKVARYMR